MKGAARKGWGVGGGATVRGSGSEAGEGGQPKETVGCLLVGCSLQVCKNVVGTGQPQKVLEQAVARWWVGNQTSGMEMGYPFTSCSVFI